MDLWIRSQDKETLVKCNCIDIMWVEGMPNIYVNEKFPDYIVATYETKERALEILGEIQKLLTPQIFALAENIRNNPQDTKPINVFCIDNGKGQLDVKEFSNVVYEMPEK